MQERDFVKTVTKIDCAPPAGEPRKLRVAAYCRVSTDDYAGTIRAYTGEGELTKDPMNTFGGFGVARIPRLQKLLRHICEKGFEHHVAINPSRTAAIVQEAFTKYLGWTVYNHDGAQAEAPAARARS